jgi:hypothetical protein
MKTFLCEAFGDKQTCRADVLFLALQNVLFVTFEIVTFEKAYESIMATVGQSCSRNLCYLMFLWICVLGQHELYDVKKSLFVGLELNQARLDVSPLHNVSIATSKGW